MDFGAFASNFMSQERHRGETWVMKKYVVEVMSGDTVTSRQLVDAHTASAAASRATGRAVRIRVHEELWVRVTDEELGVVHKYAFFL